VRVFAGIAMGCGGLTSTVALAREELSVRYLSAKVRELALSGRDREEVLGRLEQPSVSPADPGRAEVLLSVRLTCSGVEQEEELSAKLGGKTTLASWIVDPAPDRFPNAAWGTLTGLDPRPRRIFAAASEVIAIAGSWGKE
jgi:hypothetical protein